MSAKGRAGAAGPGNDDAATVAIREIAVRHHHLAAAEFERRYALMAEDRFTSAFSYGRHKVDQLLVEELRRLEPDASVLDVGCGTGPYLELIEAMGHRATGVEPADAMREVAAREHPSATVQPGISSSLPFDDGSFDLVMAIEVFRYLGRADVHASYAETWRVLAPGGRFFFTMVNRDALDGFWLLQRVRERFTKGRFDEVHPHCEFVTPPMVERDLRRAGFTDVTTVGRLFGPVRLVYKVSPRLARGLARRIERWDDALSSRRAMRRFGGHLICTATKPGAT